MFKLDDKTALITGAGQNVGAGVARTLASQGARVLINDILADRAAAVAGEIAAAGGLAEPLAFDVTDGDAVREAVADRPIDILVNNAGNAGAEAMGIKPFAQTEPADWAGPLAVNLDGVMNCTHAVLAGMIERGWGRIIGIVSGAGTIGVNIGVAAYSAGKGGAAGLLRSVALEVAHSGVTVNSVALGLMSHTGGTGATDHLARAIPTRRLGTPEDVAALCAYLASEEASWMTAQTIPLAGGAITS
ncbi:MAG: SDR family NAD(P)-dependent oxidoreductase [bacterium]|nr:SDR family NAD(P)-dependent oxidoreductase [bacterium]MCY4273704.1 SDR family NAD(P)-dependent oxidoreductase [bacterium]